MKDKSEETKTPLHGQIRTTENGLEVYIDKTAGSRIKTDTFTPDSIRDKELQDLRDNLTSAKHMNWWLFGIGIIVGIVIGVILSLFVMMRFQKSIWHPLRSE